jgi:hypothetical protein
MTTEGGNQKVLSNFHKLIEFVSADPNYNPSNSLIVVSALQAKETAVSAAMDDVANKNAPNKTAIRERIEAFEALAPTARQVRNVAKGSGEPEAALANLDTPLRKLSGGRASAKIKDDPNTPEDESAGQHSASQMSYDNRTGNWRSFIALVKELTKYKPNEAHLRVPALEAYADHIEAKNNAVVSTFVAFNQARVLRDQLLYLNDDSVVNLAALVKAYVKGAMGVDSPLYKLIKGLEFARKG